MFSRRTMELSTAIPKARARPERVTRSRPSPTIRKRRKVVRVEKRGEPGEIKRLKARVRKLETSLADAHMDGALADAFLEMLGERTDTDIEAFKKTHGATALGARTRNSTADEA